MRIMILLILVRLIVAWLSLVLLEMELLGLERQRLGLLGLRVLTARHGTVQRDETWGRNVSDPLRIGETPFPVKLGTVLGIHHLRLVGERKKGIILFIIELLNAAFAFLHCEISLLRKTRSREIGISVVQCSARRARSRKQRLSTGPLVSSL
jgi:hypothetical protein